MSEIISILVIEDEEHLRNVLKYNLELDGFEVYLAEDGPAGIELARREQPDLILLDWMMPEMDGMEVLSKLRSDEKTKDIAVFMLTAKGTTRDVGRALYQGADEYITKPFDPIQLPNLIRKKLSRLARDTVKPA